MALSPLDDPVLAGVYVSAEVDEIFSSKHWLRRLLDVEAALAEAQAETGVIPEVAANAIAGLDVHDLDIEALGARTAVVGFPIVGLVEQIAAQLPDGLGQYAHWGATTQDILDTALVLQLRDAVGVMQRDVAATGDLLAALADRHSGTLMIGRSQLQPGLPTTFGLRAAGWLSALTRNLERLDQLRPRLLVSQLSGAVGTAASLGPAAQRTAARFAEILDLEPAAVNWHTQRDSLAEAGQVAALLAASLGKIGLDVVLASQFEVGELHETPAGAGAGTSSTMPQKRNPILAQRLLHAARLTRPLSTTVVEAVVTDHDRGTGVWPTEWVALPQLVGLAATAAGTARQLIEGLEVDTDRMAANLAAVGDPLLAESAMMALAPRIGRQQAHDVVAAALTDLDSSGLVAALRARGHELDPATLDPARYLGSAPQQVDAAVSSWQAIRHAEAESGTD